MPRKRSLISLPLPFLRDPSTTLRDVRVLGALEYFCDRSTGVSSPDRAEVAALSGIRPEHVSKITSNLARAGWIEKSGRGCRSNPTQYTLLWLLKNEDESAGNGAVSGTQYEPERVPSVAPNHDGKGAVSGTQSPGKGAVSGTQSPGKGAISGTQSDDQRVGARAYKYLNKYIYKTSDPIRSDLARFVSGSKIDFGTAVNVLESFGAIPSFFRSPKDRAIIKSWVDESMTEEWLRHVCDHAVQRKGDSRIGPRYVDKVMSTIVEEVMNGQAGGKTNSGTGHSAGDAAGEEWLRDQQGEQAAATG